MGWITFHEDRTAKEYFTDKINGETSLELVDIAIVGFRTAYLAVKSIEEGYTFCLVYLLHRAPNDHHNFGYKDMSEFSGPSVDNCPMRIINKLTPLDEIKKIDSEIGDKSIEWADNFRKRCTDRANTNKKRNKALNSGVVKTKEPIKFTSGESFQYFTKEGRTLYALANFGTSFERKVRVRISGWRNIEFEAVER